MQVQLFQLRIYEIDECIETSIYFLDIKVYVSSALGPYLVGRYLNILI